MANTLVANGVRLRRQSSESFPVYFNNERVLLTVYKNVVRLFPVMCSAE